MANETKLVLSHSGRSSSKLRHRFTWLHSCVRTFVYALSRDTDKCYASILSAANKLRILHLSLSRYTTMQEFHRLVTSATAKFRLRSIKRGLPISRYLSRPVSNFVEIMSETVGDSGLKIATFQVETTTRF